jgi:FkbM family methyltransferase
MIQTMNTKFRLKILSLILNTYESFFYTNRLVKELKKLNLNTVFDVGTNKGDFIETILNVNPYASIHAFEPNPEIYQKLKLKFNSSKIILNNKAVSDTIEKKIFYENIFNLTSSLEKPNLESKHSKKKIKTFGIKPEELIKKTYEVETITLSKYLEYNQIHHLDYLKIDTEGHEFECLKGLFNQQNCKIKYIQIEEHITESHSKSVEESKKILIENKYEELKRIKHHIGNFYDVIYMKKNFY